ncbi:MAG TPA: hypothetical protein VFQ76_03645, partial [Longimicrobiaceae bacterium]|nr:hypothetical protein [Longimicrobiaceae bacterium]
ARLFTDPARRAATIGLGAEEGAAEAVIASVVAARLTGSGSHVVVLDLFPPFVKVYDREGRLRSAFLGKGGGPTEARRPVALATAGDSLVLVADGRRISVFDLDGKLRDQLSGLPFAPLAAARGCDADWLFYGPRMESGSGAREAEWVHRVRLGSRPVIESGFRDSIPPRGVPVGLAFGFVRRGGGAVLRHELGADPVLLEWNCGARLTARRLPDEADGAGRPLEKVGGGRSTEAGAIRAGSRSQAGIAALPGGTLVADQVVGGAGEGTRTRLWGTRRGARWTATLPGAYLLRDSRPGVGVLVEADEPVPHLFVLREGDVARVLEPGS